MRQLVVAIAVCLAAGQVRADQVEVKGPHLCCKQCVKVVAGILGKVDGITNPNCDIATKTISFTAKDEKAAAAGVKAIVDGGFYGAATRDGKEMKLDVAAAKKGDKADTVSVKEVHVCCTLCQKAIAPLFKDAKVTYEGKGAQRTVKIDGKGLDKGEVLEALRKAGFNGTVEK